MKSTRTILFLFVLIGCLCPPLARGETIRYLLLGDSTFTDDCPICDRVSIPRPMRGTFDLTLVPTGLGASLYNISNVVFRVSTDSDSITLTGSGTYRRILGHPLSQEIELSLQVADSFTNRNLHFTNQFSEVNRQFPVLDAGAVESPGSPGRTYYLRIVAAPVREIWISPRDSAKNAGIPASPAGDIVTQNGRLIKSNANLVGLAGINVPVGIDAFDVIPGGEIVFSPSKQVTSETLGVIGEGDLVSTKGTIHKRNAELLSAFQVPSGTADAGLDAVQILNNGEIYFSIRSNVVSGKLGSTLSHGDILSDLGEVVVTGKDLLQSFNPPPFDPGESDPSYGLIAFYIWPNTEVWFSTGKDFVSPSLGPISRGDILSDRGYIVFRSSLLSANLGGTAGSTNGFAGFFVITDTSSLPEPPMFNAIQSRFSGFELQWNGAGRAFRVERSNVLPGIFEPISELLPDNSYIAPQSTDPVGFFRIRQW